jgi:hypothetical protein
MIFDAIRESHDLQRDLCRKLTASRGDLAARQVLFLQLKVELMAHAAAEERHLYVPLLMEDGGLDSSRHALHEHHGRLPQQPAPHGGVLLRLHEESVDARGVDDLPIVAADRRGPGSGGWATGRQKKQKYAQAESIWSDSDLEH